ncbi:MAG: phosphoglucosamine mutase [Candidatus Thermoplasmatota archaeon]|nr:phosphoglucosamine mutase [Candidatus Thermoplasmatota archaeon]
MSLFGSSGVRGLVNSQMTPELAMAIGMAVGSDAECAVIGRDSRTSGPMMEAAVSSGLMACGCEVYSAGIVSTPTLAEAAREMSCGVMLTASHNPPEYAGIKLWNPDGMGFGLEQSKKIEKLVASNRFKARPWDKVGTSHIMMDAVDRHLERILAGVGHAKLKVVVDCANGPSFNITPLVLQRMGCKVVTMNSNPDGHFPGRMPEPTDENLTDLKNTVISTKSDLGIAHDGDADRMVAIDDKGVFLGGDHLLALFAKRYAKKKAVVTVDASMAIDDYISAKITRVRVGDVFVSEEVKRIRADFGGEPSGTWIFPEQSYCPDGILAAAKIVEMASKKKLSELRKSIPTYPTLRKAVDFEAGQKASVISCLSKEMRVIECDELLTVDGFRLQFEDGWALVRPSGTEPKIRMLAEARKAERAAEIMKVITDAVKRCVK